MYCYSILKDNRRSEYSSTHHRPELKSSVQLSVLADSVHAELNTFFPFDPYRLPRSSSYIQGVYREWSSVAIDNDDEDEDDEDNEDEDVNLDDVDNGFDVPQSHYTEDSTGGLGESFGGMSISPAHRVLPMSLS